jgi:hypothetical protein
MRGMVLAALLGALALLGLAVTANAQSAEQICACTARGDVLAGQTLYGPQGEPCAGFVDWGTYSQGCSSPAALARCSPPASAVDKDVQFWGPEGQPCNGQPGWGTFSAGTVTAWGGYLGTCKGDGSLEGVRLYGPENEFCGGFEDLGQYHERFYTEKGGYGGPGGSTAEGGGF